LTFEDNSITDPRERERIFGQDDHVRMFGKDYSKRIQRSGLKAEENDFAFSQSDRYGLQKAEIIYLGRKS
jgi:hypothetical protein